MDAKPRKKASMMSRTSSRFGDDSDDMRSIASSMSLKSTAVVDQATMEEAVVFKVVELSADALLDRFLEFQDTTILIRTYEGQDAPGAIVGVISSTSNAPMPVQSAPRTSASKSLSELRNANQSQPIPSSGDNATELRIIHYTDKDFFHVFDFKQPLLLCSPSNPGSRFSDELRRSLEKTLKVACIPMPVMSINVACSFTTLTAISAFVAAKESIAGGNRNENDFSGISALPSSVANSLSASSIQTGASTKNAFRNNSGSSGDSTASSNLVNEFCLMFFQTVSSPDLLRALDRIRMSVQSTQIPRRVGPVLDSFLATVNPLLEVFWKAKYSSIIRDEVSSILQQIIFKILDANVAFMFLRHAAQCQQLLFGLLSDSTHGSFSSTGHQCIVSLFSLLSSVDCVKELRASGHSSGKLSDLLMIALRIAESCSSAFQGASNSSDVQDPLVSSKALALALSLGSLRPMENESLARRNESRSRDELSTLWTSLPVCLDVIMTALDDVVASLASAPNRSDHELMKVAIVELNRCVMLALRSLYGAPLELVKTSVARAAPSMSSYFRRIASWGEYLNVSPLWPEVLSEGIAFVVCVTLAREHSANSLPFVQHEWLARISIATGPLAARSLMSEAHEMFVTFSCVFPDWIDRQSASHALMKAIVSQLLVISERIVRSAPSPSLLLSCWENCRVIISHYLNVVNDTLGLQSRVALARTLIENGLGSALDGAAQHRGASINSLPLFHEELQDNSDWDDLMSYREWNLRGSAGRFPAAASSSSSVIPLPFVAGLYYILPAVEHEKLSKRWNALAANLFKIAQVLVDLSAPLALSTQFVEAAVQISQKFRGFDRASSASICQRYVVEAFDRISCASAWKLSSSFLARGGNASQLQVEHESEKKNPIVALGHFSVAAALDEDEPKVSVVQPNQTSKSSKRANVLFKIATTYKDS